MNAILRSAAPFAVTVASLLMSACRFQDAAPPSSSAGAADPAAGSPEGRTRGDSAQQNTGGMQGMTGLMGTRGMPGMRAGRTGSVMDPGMMDAGMMDSMRIHMRMMDGMSPGQMKAMLPAHREMVGSMLLGMTREMRRLNTPAGSVWSATADSLRQDLTHMSDLTGSELKEMMPAHRARVMRLVEMHRDMMKMANP